jgi:hypothetical protein
MTTDEKKEYWMRCFCAALTGLAASELPQDEVVPEAHSTADEALDVVMFTMDILDDPKEIDKDRVKTFNRISELFTKGMNCGLNDDEMAEVHRLNESLKQSIK